MSTTLSFLIRDGLESDVEPCLKLDHLYETDYVWQMNIHQETGSWQVSFKTERLPRTLEAKYPVDERRIKLALPKDQCFLVAVSRDEPELLAYLTMRNDPVYHIALIQDLVVSRTYRRRGIGKRLLSVARTWAKEHQLTRLMVEIQTRNYLGINFCQSCGFVFCGFNDRYMPNQDIAVFFSQSIR